MSGPADIAAALKRIEAKLDAVLAKRQQEERSRPAKAQENIAPDSDLDSKYGDPKVRFDPRDWAGESMKGRTFSQCPADYLEMMASALEYFADKKAASDPQKAGYDRKDAARARGWARREPAAKPSPGGGSYDFGDGQDPADPDSDIPF